MKRKMELIVGWSSLGQVRVLDTKLNRELKFTVPSVNPADVRTFRSAVQAITARLPADAVYRRVVLCSPHQCWNYALEHPWGAAFRTVNPMALVILAAERQFPHVLLCKQNSILWLLEDRAVLWRVENGQIDAHIASNRCENVGVVWRLLNRSQPRHVMTWRAPFSPLQLRLTESRFHDLQWSERQDIAAGCLQYGSRLEGVEPGFLYDGFWTTNLRVTLGGRPLFTEPCDSNGIVEESLGPFWETKSSILSIAVRNGCELRQLWTPACEQFLVDLKVNRNRVVSAKIRWLENAKIGFCFYRDHVEVVSVDGVEHIRLQATFDPKSKECKCYQLAHSSHAVTVYGVFDAMDGKSVPGWLTYDKGDDKIRSVFACAQSTAFLTPVAFLTAIVRYAFHLLPQEWHKVVRIVTAPDLSQDHVNVIRAAVARVGEAQKIEFVDFGVALMQGIVRRRPKLAQGCTVLLVHVQEEQAIHLSLLQIGHSSARKIAQKILPPSDLPDLSDLPHMLNLNCLKGFKTFRKLQLITVCASEELQQHLGKTFPDAKIFSVLKSEISRLLTSGCLVRPFRKDPLWVSFLKFVL